MSDKAQVGENNVLRTAVETGQFLDLQKWSHYFIGGIAYLRWGEPRQTTDVDAVLLAGLGNEKQFTEVLTAAYESRIDNPIPFAIQNRIVLVEDKRGIGIDLSLGALPFEERMMQRASVWVIPEHGELRTCSPEDLITLKSIASRPQDWIDVEKVIIRQGAKLDRDLILEELTPLVQLKEEPEILTQLNSIFEKHPS
jgi:hypothetical protein